MNGRTERRLWLMRAVVLSLAMIVSTRPARAADMRLNVYNWSSYVADDTIANFEKEHGVEVTYDNYSSNEELLAKLLAGASGYDVIFPSDYMVSIMRGKGLLKPLDKTQLRNLPNLDGSFLNRAYDPGNAHCVPYLWGTSGIAVNSAKVTDDIRSWKVLWDERFRGKISILDDVRSAFVPALKRLGASINTTDQAVIARAEALLREQKPLVHSYSSDTYIDMLRTGEVWIAYGYSGDIYQAARDNTSIRYVIPDEGTELWIDNVCIPARAPHAELAHRFIDYLLRPDVAASIARVTRYPTPNRAARELLPAEMLSDPNLYPPESVRLKSELLDDLGSNAELYEAAWSRIKAE